MRSEPLTDDVFNSCRGIGDISTVSMADICLSQYPDHVELLLPHEL